MRIQDRIGMPLDEFIRRYDDAPFELIDGEIVPKMPTVSGHNKIAKRVFMAFLPFEQQGLGEVFQEAAYIHTERPDWVSGSRIPDVMWVAAAKLAEFRETVPDADRRPFIFVPDIVVEVVSTANTPADIQRGVATYLRHGVSLIWVIYPETRQVAVYRHDSQQLALLSGDDALDASSVLPGFTLALKDIFG